MPRGGVFDTFIGVADTLFLNQLTEQTQKFNAQVKGNKSHDLGPPHLYAFLGCLDGLLKNHADQVGANNAEMLKQWKLRVDPMTRQELAEEIRMFRLSKVYDRDKRRLTIALAPNLQEERKCLIGCLDQLKWQRKYGRAPPSHMERELQEFLDVLVGNK